MAQTNLLVIIDPQVDFHEGGSLAVAGATKDTERICKLIKAKSFDNIVVTLDTHQYLDIAHPLWWINDKGERPGPVTPITLKDVEDGKWKPAQAAHLKWTKTYLKELEGTGHFTHIVWPNHCIIGTPGHGVEKNLCETLQWWSEKNHRLVTYLWKGTNPKAEMYSAFKAEVVVPGAAETQLNTKILERMKGYDNILVCGQAKSHCVRHSFTDMVNYFNSKGGKKPNCILVNDCCSAIPNFEEATAKWVSGVQKNDFVKVLDSTDWAGPNVDEQKEQ